MADITHRLHIVVPVVAGATTGSVIFGAAVFTGFGAIETAVVVGATVASLPPSCTSVVVNGVAYQHCGPNWYQPQYVGTQVQYIVVTAPR